MFPGALANTAGSEDEDDRDDSERSEKRGFAGTLQRPHCFPLPAGRKLHSFP